MPAQASLSVYHHYDIDLNLMHTIETEQNYEDQHVFGSKWCQCIDLNAAVQLFL